MSRIYLSSRQSVSSRILTLLSYPRHGDIAKTRSDVRESCQRCCFLKLKGSREIDKFAWRKATGIHDLWHSREEAPNKSDIISLFLSLSHSPSLSLSLSLTQLAGSPMNILADTLSAKLTLASTADYFISFARSSRALTRSRTIVRVHERKRRRRRNRLSPRGRVT